MPRSIIHCGQQRSRTAVETRSLYENQLLWSELEEMCFAPPKAAPLTVSTALVLLDKHMSLASLSASSAPHLLFGVEQSTVADVLGPAKTRAEVRPTISTLLVLIPTQQAAQIQTLLLSLLTDRLKARLQAVASFFDASNEGAQRESPYCLHSADVCLSSQSLEGFVNGVKDLQAKVRQIEQEASASKARALRSSFECQKVTLKALALVQELILKQRLQCVYRTLTLFALICALDRSTRPMLRTVSGCEIVRLQWR